MNTLTTNPTRSLRTSTNPWLNPFNRLFRNDFFDLWDEDNLNTIPALNITEEKDNYKVELAAPGLRKEDFNIDIDGNLLTISCEKETETKEPKKGNGYSRREYNYSAFSRSFTLPEFAETNKIVAKYNDGILNLSIPKKPEAQKSMVHKIKVQ